MTAGTHRENWLEIDRLSVHYGDRPALDTVTLTFGPSEIVSLVGPNGAGKSTLLRCLAGLLPPSHGEVRFRGARVHRPTSDIIYVPQRTSVDWGYPSSVLDVVLMALIRKRSRFAPFAPDDRERALAQLAMVGMDHLAGVQISQLSGGQQQRVFLARALLSDGLVFLLDEPFTGIDAPTQELISTLFIRLCRSGKTVIAATHDLEQAATTSDRIVLLNRSVVADGTPTDVFREDVLDRAYDGQFSMFSRLLNRGAA
ncbi:MAG: metal ABC transporter ATP-binding protein [Thermomicrobiales bacterium]